MNGAAGKMSRCFRYRPAAPSFYVRNTVFTSEIPEKHSFEKTKLCFLYRNIYLADVYLIKLVQCFQGIFPEYRLKMFLKIGKCRV